MEDDWNGEITVTPDPSFKGLVEDIVTFVNGSIVPLLFAIAFLAILFGILRYFFFQGEENLQKGRQFILWGGIAFIVMFSIWGILQILLTSLELSR